MISQDRRSQKTGTQGPIAAQAPTGLSGRLAAKLPEQPELRQVAEAEPDPARRLWRVFDAYLATFAGQPHAARLWFEYWIALSRRNASAPIRGDLANVSGLFRGLLADAGHPKPADTADLVVSWLLGAVVRPDVSTEPDQRGRRELQRLVEAGYS